MSDKWKTAKRKKLLEFLQHAADESGGVATIYLAKRLAAKQHYQASGLAWVDALIRYLNQPVTRRAPETLQAGSST